MDMIHARAFKRKNSLHVRESKTNLVSGFHTVDSSSCKCWIPDFSLVELGFRIPLLPEFWILKLYSGLQSPGFRIQSSLIPKSVLPYMEQINE